MTPKQSREDRKTTYKEMLKTHPFHADGIKRLIYTDKEEKDSYGIIPIVIGSRVDLKRIATLSDNLFDEELDDLRYLLKSQIGKKNFKKLAKVFGK